MMRTVLSGVGLAVGLGVGLSPAQVRAEGAGPSRRTLVLAQPVNQLGVGVEHAVGSHVSLAASVFGEGYLEGTRADGVNAGASSRRWRVGVDPGVHVYLAGRAPEGLWVGPHLEASASRHTHSGRIVTPEGEQDARGRSDSLFYGGSVRVGYTAILSPGLALQVGLGVAALGGRTTGSVGATTLAPRSTWSVEPRMSLGVGWAF